VKTDAPTPSFAEALRRVLGMQDKLHQWSKRDATARFADLFNLVADPAFLLIAWERVSTNTGARSAGVDGLTVRAITAADRVEDFLAGLRAQLKSGTFVPSTGQATVDPEIAGQVPTARDTHGRGIVRSVPARFGFAADHSSVSPVVRPPGSGVVDQAAGWPVGVRLRGWSVGPGDGA
jgi:hypothetical protein